MPDISKAIQIELADFEYGFKSLERFKDALDDNDSEIEFIDISVRPRNGEEFNTLEIFPENGSLYVDIQSSKKDLNNLVIDIYGIGGSIRFFYDKHENALTFGLPPFPKPDVRPSDRDKSKLELPYGLRVHCSNLPDINFLNKGLKQRVEFNRAISLFEEVAKEESRLNLEPLTSKELQSDAGETDEIESEKLIKPIGISTRDLWKNILKTETESYPYIVLVTASEAVPDTDDQVILNHESEHDPLSKFNKDDVIEAIYRQGEDEKILGVVNLKKSDLAEVRLLKIRSIA